MDIISSFIRSISSDIKWNFYVVIFLILVSISKCVQAYEMKPRIIQFSRNQLALPGETIRLTCLAIGDAPLHVSWFVNGNRYLIYSNRRTEDGLLSTAEVRNIHDSVHVTCRVRNYVGVVNETSRILIKANKIPPRFVVKPKPVYRYFHHSSLSIPCVAYGEPMPMVHWEKDSKRETKDSIATISGIRAILKLTNIRESNYYTCVATSSAGTIRAVSVVIDGNGDRFPPRIKAMQKIKMLESIHEPFEQTCTAVGRPLPRPSWWHDGKFIRSKDNRTEINWQTTLRIPSITERSAFMCRAETWTEKAEAWIRVYVRGLLQFVTIPPMYMVVDYGEPVTLQCRVAGLPQAKVVWYKTTKDPETGEDHDLPMRTIQDFQIFDETEGTARLQGVTEIGTYKCKATSTGSPLLHKTTIYVRKSYRAPRIVEFPSDVKIKPWSSIELTCTGVGYPPPRVYWTGAGRKRHVRSARVNRGMRSTVTVNNLSASKTFTCAAESALGRTIRTVSVEIEKVLLEESKVTTTVLVTMNSSANINCTASGNPLPKVNWMSEDGRRLNGKEMIVKDTKISLLHVKSVTRPLVFICVAVSSFGRVYKVVKVIPTNVPIMSITPLKYIHKGDDVTLSCRVRAPWKIMVFWHPRSKGTKQVTKPISDGRIAMLKLQHVKRPVNYTCIVLSKALSGKGTQVFYRTKRIKLLIAPIFVTKPPHVSFVNKSGSLNLNCSANGEPMPDVYWDWSSGNKTGRGGSANLTLTNITVSCLVRCIAKSKAGMAKTTVAVIIKGDLNFTIPSDDSKQLLLNTIPAKVKPESTNIPLPTTQKSSTAASTSRARHEETSATEKITTTTTLPTTEKIVTTTTIPTTEKSRRQSNFRSDFNSDITREPQITISTTLTPFPPVSVTDRQAMAKSTPSMFVKESVSQSTELPSTSMEEVQTKAKGNVREEGSYSRSTAPVTLKRLESTTETSTKQVEVTPYQTSTTIQPSTTTEEKQISSPTHSSVKTSDDPENKESIVNPVQNQESKQISTDDKKIDETSDTQRSENGPEASLDSNQGSALSFMSEESSGSSSGDYGDGYDDGYDDTYGDGYNDDDRLPQDQGSQYSEYDDSGANGISGSTGFGEEEEDDDDDDNDDDGVDDGVDDETADYDYPATDPKLGESDYMYINSVG